MRVVVIGATGNVGISLLRALKDRPEIDHVVGVARRPPGKDEPAGVGYGGKVSWHQADLTSDDLVPVMDGADAIVHLAWQIQPARRRSQLHLTNVHGSRRVFDAVLASGVQTLVYASSVGTYAPGPKDRTVDESWPHTGIASSSYSRDKATVEALLDRLEAAHPTLRVVRLRPALIFQRDAGTEIARYFLGPLVPRAAVRPRMLPIVPMPDVMRFQAVHTDDVAQAYVAALLRDVRGAFNIAADPVLDTAQLARLFKARPVHAPLRAVRALASATYALGLQPTDAGWVDMAALTPLMDTTRARDELAWQPRMSADAALLDLTEGIHQKSTGPTPALR